MIPTVRSFIAGNSGSGKTTLAWRLYLSKVPRFIVIDQIGEWNDKVDVATDTLPELVDAIRALSSKSGKWCVSYSLADDRYEDLVQWLIPVPDVTRSPIITLGGAVLLNDEIDLVAPFGPPPPHIRTLYRRSRHVGLSILSLTSVPANVSKEVTRQSTQRVALFLDEPSDIKYMADAMRWGLEQVERWQAWTVRYPHGAAFREVLTGRLLWLNEAGQPVADSQVDGLLVSQSGQPLQQAPQQQQRQITESQFVSGSSVQPVGERQQDEPPDEQADGTKHGVTTNSANSSEPPAR